MSHSCLTSSKNDGRRVMMSVGGPMYACRLRWVCPKGTSTGWYHRMYLILGESAREGWPSHCCETPSLCRGNHLPYYAYTKAALVSFPQKPGQIWPSLVPCMQNEDPGGGCVCVGSTNGQEKGSSSKDKQPKLGRPWQRELFRAPRLELAAIISVNKCPPFPVAC